MTSSSRLGRPLGLVEQQRREQARAEGKLSIIAQNGATIFGGAERALVAILAGLQKRGHIITLCCNHDVVANEAVRRFVPAIVTPLRGDAMFGDAWTFAKFLRREKPDALLLGTFKKIWLAGMAGRQARVPRVVARVGLATDTPRRIKYRIALQHWIDTVVLNADSMRGSFLAGMPDSYDATRVLTIHSGVAPLPVTRTREEMRREFGIPPDAPVIGTLARLAGQKRLERLIELTALLPVVHCVIAGEGRHRLRLEEKIRDLAVTDRVHLLGHREDRGNVLTAFDLYVVASDLEGLSNAMLESLSVGVPVVSTPVSGAHEALAPLPDGRVPGVVIDGTDPKQLAAAVGPLLADPAARARMGEAGLERVREAFDYERGIDRWEAVLRGEQVPR